jgi:NADPH-dependent curcumin reductase CurA
MNEDTGAEYLKPWQIGETITGLFGIGAVIKSNHENFIEGDYIQGSGEWPWKKYFIVNMQENLNRFTKASFVISFFFNNFF